MRTTISIQGKDYRVAITPQTIVYVAKASGKFSLKTLQDENALKEMFEQMDLEMMEGLLYASLETGAYLDKKELDLSRDQVSKAYYFEPGLMEEFSEIMEAQLGAQESEEKKPKQG